MLRSKNVSKEAKIWIYKIIRDCRDLDLNQKQGKNIGGMGTKNINWNV